MYSTPHHACGSDYIGQPLPTTLYALLLRGSICFASSCVDLDIVDSRCLTVSLSSSCLVVLVLLLQAVFD